MLTSGGDAPGMNAAIRAVVRCAVAYNLEVIGFKHGFTGLIGGEYRVLGARDVGGVIHQGGTMLGTTRCQTLMSERGRELALRALSDLNVSALVVIGGNGSQTGSWELSQRGAPVIGIASTIDNDLNGTDLSLGVTTAVDVALEAIDRLRVTASAMNRAFLVEVMGRNCGYIAMMAGIAGGAELILVPEACADPGVVADELRAVFVRGKSHAIAVVAEGAAYNADVLMHYFKEHDQRLGFDLRVTKLGHVQRGGKPGVMDRMLGTMFGSAAIDAVIANRLGVLIGLRDGKTAWTPLGEVAGKARPADARILKLAQVLAL